MRFLACLALAGACTTSAPLAATSEPDTQPARETTEGAIVVELFTSQGCSSCPPADRLLSELANHEHERPVIALAFHVDYWNDLGWRDPFSSSAATERQEMYTRALGRGLYTPQLVVNGRAHVVGSRRGEVDRALAAARPVTTLAASAQLQGSILHVAATVPTGAHAIVAVVEDALDTEVRAGENRGEHLRNDRVVRALAPLDDGRANVSVDPSWRRDHLGAVVLANGADGSIVAATSLAF
jgi:hypothetical protein